MTACGMTTLTEWGLGAATTLMVSRPRTRAAFDGWLVRSRQITVRSGRHVVESNSAGVRVRTAPKPAPTVVMVLPG